MHPISFFLKQANCVSETKYKYENIFVKGKCLIWERIPDSSVGKESTCNAEDPSSIPRSGRSSGEGISYPLWYSWASLWLSWLRILPQCRRPGFNPWVGKIPWRREWLPTPVFWSGEFHGLYTPWGHKDLDTVERLSLRR